jgi:hypothetical protein
MNWIAHFEEEDDEADDHWAQPFCFVKPKNRTKEFIGCTSMNEAFHRLDMARAVVDIRRYNYICKAGIHKTWDSTVIIIMVVCP